VVQRGAIEDKARNRKNLRVVEKVRAGSSALMASDPRLEVLEQVGDATYARVLDGVVD
jgi:hypothetical protein